MMLQEFKEIMYLAPAVLIAMVGHEYAHGLVSYWLGDMTPKQEGRLSLNPLKHLDPVGTLCLLLFKFGWAKPVRVNPASYRNGRLGMALVALAGPVMNFLMAFASTFLFVLIFRNPLDSNAFTEYLYYALNYLIIINVGLGTFNLIPVPPLDGSKILGAVLPERLYFSLMRYERYGMAVLMILLFLNILDGPLIAVRNGMITGMMELVFRIFNI